MMKINVIFDYAKVFDFKSLSVDKDQKFIIEVENFVEGAEWFSNNDEVLTIKANENLASVESSNYGNSKILLIKDGAIILSLDIEVIEKVKLNPQLVSKELK